MKSRWEKYSKQTSCLAAASSTETCSPLMIVFMQQKADFPTKTTGSSRRSDSRSLLFYFDDKQSSAKTLTPRRPNQRVHLKLFNSSFHFHTISFSMIRVPIEFIEFTSFTSSLEAKLYSIKFISAHSS